jgi:hypothetical protein
LPSSWTIRRRSFGEGKTFAFTVDLFSASENVVDDGVFEWCFGHTVFEVEVGR